MNAKALAILAAAALALYYFRQHQFDNPALRDPALNDALKPISNVAG